MVAASRYISKSVRLGDEIRSDIALGVFEPGATLPPDTELAGRYGAGRATVRRALLALLDEGALVKNPRRGYAVPAAGAEVPTRGAAEPGRGYSFAAFCHYPPGGWEAEVFDGIARYAGEAGLTTYRLHYDDAAEAARQLLTLPDSDTAGAIVLPLASPEFDDALRRLAKRGFPLVCVDRPPPDGLPLPSVEVDNLNGAYLAASSMLKKYRKRAFFLGFELDSCTAKARYEGYCRAMFDAGFGDLTGESTLLIRLSEADRGLWHSPERSRLVKEKAIELIRRGKAPVLIACLNDHTALGVYAASRELGLRIGKDIMVTGFDDLPLADCQTPRLTSVRQPRCEIGYEAARLLAAVIEGRKMPAARKILPVELIERASS